MDTPLDLGAGAALKSFVAGQTLIRAGDRNFKFFVVDESGERPRTLAVLRRGEFIGDVAGGAARATAVARGENRAFEVSAEGAREFLTRFTAVRAHLEAARFGARLSIAAPGTAPTFDSSYPTLTEAPPSRKAEVVVVGGGNSAGHHLRAVELVDNTGADAFVHEYLRNR